MTLGPRWVWWLLGGAVLGAFLAGGILASCHRQSEEEILRERDAAKAQVDSARADVKRVLTVSAAFRDSAERQDSIQDDALTSANRRSQRIAVLLARAQRTVPTDSGTIVILPDSIELAKTCEERYGLRTLEAMDLRRALDACDRSKIYERDRADTLQLSLFRTERALVSSDSARLVEIDRPRKCTRSLLVIRVPCWQTDLLMLGGGLVAGIVVAK